MRAAIVPVGVNVDIFWDVVTTKLPTLLPQIDRIIKEGT